MSARWSAFLVWGLAAAATVFWALRLSAPVSPVPAHAQVAENGPLLVGDLTRLLGAPPVKVAEPAAFVPDAASRFKLTGVVATRPARDAAGIVTAGVALISVDGKPPQAYRVGDALDMQLVLQSVELRSVSIGSGAARGFVLSLPPPTAPATGVPASMGAGMMPLPGVTPNPVPLSPAMTIGNPMDSIPSRDAPPPAAPAFQNRGQIQ